jgi:hypothetical protein
MRKNEHASQGHDHHDRAMEMCCKARLCQRPVLSLFGPVIGAASGREKPTATTAISCFAPAAYREFTRARLWPGCCFFPVIYRKNQTLDAARHRAAPPAAAVVAAALDHYV